MGTHCWSDFMNSTGWDIWYAAYQVIIKSTPIVIISTLNFLMFLQLRILWKQKRELKKTIRSSSVFTLPTPINSKQVQKDSICSSAIFVEEKHKIDESGNGDAQKEVKMTLLLLSFVATYVTLTVPCNITLIYWSLYPEVYVSMQDKHRV